MDCRKEKLERTPVFQSNILIPLMKILNAYKAKEHNLTPDEFCILIFTEKEGRAKLKWNSDSIGSLTELLHDIEIPPVSVHEIIIDLFMNVVRYEFLLEELSKDFLNVRRFRRHGNLNEIMVLLYALMYRVSTLSFDDSLDCFKHFKVPNMLSLVSYLLRDETLDLLHKKACTVFEECFVEQQLILPFLEAVPRLKELHGFLRARKREIKGEKRKLTVPVFMNVLNRPTKFPAVPPPTPEDTATRRFARKVPRSLYSKPTTEDRLRSLRATNKLQAINLLGEANRNAPSCLRRKIRQRIAEEKEERPTIAINRGVPNFKPVEVKQNAASILRECARIVSDETKEMKKLKELAEGGYDPSSIIKLEEERRRSDREKELQRVEEKRLLALLSREGAFVARKLLLNEIKSHAQDVRKERQELSEKLEKWKQDHSKQMIEIVERCRDIEQASREAFNSMIDEKRQKAAEVSAESRLLKETLAKQREEESRRKIQLIQEIKTVQSLRSLHSKDFDPTESSGLGLLCEMSLAELRERLFWTKLQLNEEIENRKILIRRQREKYTCFIKDSQKALAEYKANRHVTSSSEVTRESSKASTPEIEALRKKLEERRAFRLEK